PYMLNIGRHCAKMLDIDDLIHFTCMDFKAFQSTRSFDVVYSFAAHYTEDEQHRPDLRQYCERIHSLLEPGGLLVFESHGFDSTNEQFQSTIWTMNDLFKVEDHKKLFDGKRELFFFRKA